MIEIGQMAAVAGVLTLLALTLWFLRKRGLAGVLPAGRKPARRLECLERLSLGPHHTLHLVRMGETSLLVASSPGGCSLLQSNPPVPGFPQDAVAHQREDVR
jgi:flagellar biosynthetic protein FliO